MSDYESCMVQGVDPKICATYSKARPVVDEQASLKDFLRAVGTVLSIAAGAAAYYDAKASSPPPPAPAYVRVPPPAPVVCTSQQFGQIVQTVCQ